MASGFAEIAVTLPIRGRFHYKIPEGMALEVGHRVLVPFGNRRITGFVLGFSEDVPAALETKIKPVELCLDSRPLVSPDLLGIIDFAAEYYLASQGEVLKTALPPGLTAGSVIRYRLTDAGRARIPDAPEKELGLLKDASRSGGLKRTSKNTRTAEALVAAGYLTRKESVDAKSAHRTVESFEMVGGQASDGLGRSRVQAEVFQALEGGARSIDELSTQFDRPALRRALRALLKKGLVRRFEHRPGFVQRAVDPAVWAVDLTDEQKMVLEPINSAISEGRSQNFLLRGVTGSGKTEIYLHAIREVRKRGGGAIVLVPEIALTSQLEARFRDRFGDDVVVLHSAMSERERRLRWDRLHRGEARIALGPRSAVWAPVQDLKFLVVDEEHDPSFKQHSDLRYSGRDLAVLRAHRSGGVALLGSATPSLETRHLVQTGKMVELRLKYRVGHRPMPEVSVVDLRSAPRTREGELPMLSAALVDALHGVLERKEQAILFLNRRGFNTVVVCEECSEARRCENCDVAFTYHKHRNRLVCHHCDASDTLERGCLDCGSPALVPYGAGTERVTEFVKETFVDARVLRLDRDITQKVGALDETLAAFRAQDADILVGTQMVTKGHDFPKVTLVGIMCADSSLAFPDFRAAERTFQLLTQVSGRAGRADRPGHVFVQTFQPEHYALQCAVTHDEQRFFDLEYEIRRAAEYPPFSRLGVIRIESENAQEATRAAGWLAKVAREAAQKEGARVLGPAPAPIERIKGRTRKMVLIFAKTPARLVRVLRATQNAAQDQNFRATLIFDIDAVDLL